MSMNQNLKLIAKDLSKSFYLFRPVFSGINLGILNSDVFGIAGENGSGKSTLLKILAGVSSPTAGEVNFYVNEKIIDESNQFEMIGFVSPYLSIYEEFTPVEHFYIASKIKGLKQNKELELNLLKEFKLIHRRNDPIKTFSSGMKQSVKFILAFSSEPSFIFLDEPFTNLDSEGIGIVCELIKSHQDKGGITVIASNDDREKSLCNKIIELKKQV